MNPINCGARINVPGFESEVLSLSKSDLGEG